MQVERRAKSSRADPRRLRIELQRRSIFIGDVPERESMVRVTHDEFMDAVRRRRLEDSLGERKVKGEPPVYDANSILKRMAECAWHAAIQVFNTTRQSTHGILARTVVASMQVTLQRIHVLGQHGMQPFVDQLDEVQT